MLFNSSVVSYGILAVGIISMMVAILVTDKLSIVEVLGQQAADNINNNPAVAIDTGEIIEVSIVPGGSSLGGQGLFTRSNQY